MISILESTCEQKKKGLVHATHRDGPHQQVVKRLGWIDFDESQERLAECIVDEDHDSEREIT